MSVNMGRPKVLTASRMSGFRRAISSIVDEIESAQATQVNPTVESEQGNVAARFAASSNEEALAS